MNQLTEEQINEIYDKASAEAWNSLTASAPKIFPILFARAIEAHHGIQDRQSPEA